MSAPTVQEPLRDRVGRAIYEEPKRRGRGLPDDWYSLPEERREPWRQDADRALAVIAPTGMTRMRAALLWALGHIETTEEPDIDALHDAVAWGLGKQDIRNRDLRAELARLDDGGGAICKYGDPLCPCPDGDPCHYDGTNPMTPPASWVCPINYEGCTHNCGNYGCGN